MDSDDLQKWAKQVLADAEAKASHAIDVEIEEIGAEMLKLSARLDQLSETIAPPTFLGCPSCHNKTFAIQIIDDVFDVQCAFPLCCESLGTLKKDEDDDENP